ncbi:hypothetical protein OT109_06410 [Phycisphaeraceae bacterium D3-23]
MERGPDSATQSTQVSDQMNTHEGAAGLLALVDAPGTDMGAALLRLAHRAAAQHRLAAAMQHQFAGTVPLNDVGGVR